MQQAQTKSHFQKCGFQYKASSWGTGKCSTSTTRRQLAAWVIFACDCWMWQIENGKEYEFMLWEWSNPASTCWLKPANRCGVLWERNAIQVLKNNNKKMVWNIFSSFAHFCFTVNSFFLLYGRWKITEEPLKCLCKAWIAIDLLPFLLLLSIPFAFLFYTNAGLAFLFHGSYCSSTLAVQKQFQIKLG